MTLVPVSDLIHAELELRLRPASEHDCGNKRMHPSIANSVGEGKASQGGLNWRQLDLRANAGFSESGLSEGE